MRSISKTNVFFIHLSSTIDYYPFGQEMPGRVWTKKYRFGYNGKENDNEIADTGCWQNYGMREYDARVCRFISVDPLTMEYPELTPFQFASDSPIENIDLDGLEKQRYDHLNHVKRKSADDNVVNQNNEEVKSNGFAKTFMKIKSAFSINRNFNTNLVPAGKWKKDPEQYEAEAIPQTEDDSNIDETYYSLDEVNPDAHLRQLWYEGTRETSWSPAYIDIDALMPGGYKNLFNSNTFQGFPNILSRQGSGTVDPQAILGTSQYIGGYKTLFFGTAGLLIFQAGVNPAYKETRRVRLTSYITHVSNISVQYKVRRFQYFINSTNPQGNPTLRPRWHQWLYGQPNSSTK